MQLYDKEYVDGLIAAAVGWIESDLEALMVELEKKVYLTTEKSKEVFEVQLAGKRTVPQPFNLTQPRPKPSKDSLEEPIPPKPTFKPPPKPLDVRCFPEFSWGVTSPLPLPPLSPTHLRLGC